MQIVMEPSRLSSVYPHPVSSRDQGCLVTELVNDFSPYRIRSKRSLSFQVTNTGRGTLRLLPGYLLGLLHGQDGLGSPGGNQPKRLEKYLKGIHIVNNYTAATNYRSGQK
ncbi:hypothetical protein [Methylocaldum sp. 14B]|jgi:hypothetical protein|uniref:hypothetical protein n=1 Tax=unclassified Methylocaldum TaxID=2622260 RepID=UPI00117FEA4D|nr:hypothetical protein [Methylocaldum sp. 14B]